MPPSSSGLRGVVIDALARGSSLVLVALLCAAVVHKVRVLRTGRAAEQPLLRKRDWSEGLAAGVLAAAALAEVVIAVAVAGAPALGLGALVVLLLAYTRALRTLDADESCACLGEFLDRSRRAGAVRRNLVLVAVAGAGALAYATGAATHVEPTQADVGVAAVVVAVLLARVALQRQFRDNNERLGEAT